jgi:hypothetical protein
VTAALAVACPLCGTAIPLTGLSVAEAVAVAFMVAAEGCWDCSVVAAAGVPERVPADWSTPRECASCSRVTTDTVSVVVSHERAPVDGVDLCRACNDERNAT